MRFIFLCIAILIMAVAGCSKQKHPVPQLAHLRLAGDLFNALQKKDHRNALVLIGKLKAVTHDNAFLAALEASEIGNIYISEAQEKLNQAKTAEAIKIIEDGLSKHPLNQHLLKCKQELQLLNEFQRNITRASNPQNAAELKMATERLNTLMTEYSKATDQIKPFIEKKMQEFVAMELREHQEALQSMKQEYERQLKNDPKLAKIIAAQIEYEKSISNTAE